ncbi:MAG: hypothetical protein V4640_12915 [Verrucomicrobiota bacterium]
MNPKSGAWSLIIALSGLISAHAELKVVATAPSAFQIVTATEISPALQQLLAGVNPWGLALHPDTGVVYFSDPTAGLIASIDPAVPAPVITPIVNRPASVFHGIALDAPGNRLFVLDSSDNSVKVVNLATLVQTKIAIDQGIHRPNDIAYDHVRDWLLLTDSGSDSLIIIRLDLADAPLQEVISPATVGAWGIAVNAKDGTAYFSSHDNGQAYQLNPETLVVTSIATGLNGPRGLKFDRFGRLFCLESGLNRVVQIPLAGQTVTAPTFANAINGRAFLVFENSDKDGDFLPDSWEKRFKPSVLALNAESDLDLDGRTAFNEFLFNSSPNSGADPAPVRTLTPQPGGGLSLSFQGPSTGYHLGVMLSSDMVTWQPWTGPLIQSALPDPLYSTWQMTLSNPLPSGLNASKIFARLKGSATAP